MIMEQSTLTVLLPIIVVVLAVIVHGAVGDWADFIFRLLATPKGTVRAIALIVASAVAFSYTLGAPATPARARRAPRTGTLQARRSLCLTSISTPFDAPEDSWCGGPRSELDQCRHAAPAMARRPQSR